MLKAVAATTALIKFIGPLGVSEVMRGATPARATTARAGDPGAQGEGPLDLPPCRIG